MPRPISPELVLTGYLRGAFPMCEPETGRIEWFTCDPRAVVPPLSGAPRTGLVLSLSLRASPGGVWSVAVEAPFFLGPGPRLRDWGGSEWLPADSLAPRNTCVAGALYVGPGRSLSASTSHTKA